MSKSRDGIIHYSYAFNRYIYQDKYAPYLSINTYYNLSCQNIHSTAMYPSVSVRRKLFLFSFWVYFLASSKKFSVITKLRITVDLFERQLCKSIITTHIDGGLQM